MPEIIYGTNNLNMAVMCWDGNARIIQPYSEFLRGDSGLRILQGYYGPELFRILVDETGFVRYEDNKFSLKTILEIDTMRTVMRMMGKIAEAVIVKRCKDNEEINLKWLRIASRKQIRMDTAKKFEALGTGLESTKRAYPQQYNPIDTQRDIIWVMGGMRAQMKGSTGTSGMDAGLQVKVSSDGMAYIYNDLLTGRYEIPLVYFDINDDFYKVADRLFMDRQYQGLAPISIETDLIHARAVDPEGYDEVHFYVELVTALVKGKIKPSDLIDKAENLPTMRNAVFASAFESIPSDIQIMY